MNLQFTKHRAAKTRAAMTLLELVVVIGVLALLAAVSIPKLTDLVDRSRSATQAYSTADAARMLEIYFGMNRRYPDGWDCLMKENAPTEIYVNLAPELKTPNTLLTTAALTADQITSLNSAGVSHVFAHDTSLASSLASNSGTFRHHLGTTGSGHDGTANLNTFVVVDKTTGSEGLSLLTNDLGLNPNRSATDTTLPRISINTYVVFGLGQKCTLVQTQVHEAPMLEHANSNTSYSRALVIYEVPNTGTAKAKIVGVIGPDGRSKAQALGDFTNINGAQPH